MDNGKDFNSFNQGFSEPENFDELDDLETESSLNNVSNLGVSDNYSNDVSNSFYDAQNYQTVDQNVSYSDSTYNVSNNYVNNDQNNMAYQDSFTNQNVDTQNSYVDMNSYQQPNDFQHDYSNQNADVQQNSYVDMNSYQQPNDFQYDYSNQNADVQQNSYVDMNSYQQPNEMQPNYLNQNVEVQQNSYTDMNSYQQPNEIQPDYLNQNVEVQQNSYVDMNSYQQPSEMQSVDNFPAQTEVSSQPVVTQTEVSVQQVPNVENNADVSLNQPVDNIQDNVNSIEQHDAPVDDLSFVQATEEPAPSDNQLAEQEKTAEPEEKKEPVKMVKILNYSIPMEDVIMVGLGVAILIAIMFMPKIVHIFN